MHVLVVAGLWLLLTCSSGVMLESGLRVDEVVDWYCIAGQLAVPVIETGTVLPTTARNSTSDQATMSILGYVPLDTGWGWHLDTRARYTEIR